MKDSADLPRFDALALDEDDDTLREGAARCVTRNARDVDDRQELLDALGLLPPATVTDHGLDGYLAGCRCRWCRKANSQHVRRTTPPTTTTADCPINTRTEATP